MLNSQQILPQLNPNTEQEELRRERRLARQRRRKERRRAKFILWGTVSSSVLLLGLIGFIYLQIQATLSIPAYPGINGVSCDTTEQLGFHIHAHLRIYINGQDIPIPQRIGVAPDGSCFYWLHTHDNTGIIHIEAPQKLHNLALDDFLTVWHTGFDNLGFPPELTEQTGWKIYVNGLLFTGVPVTSPLTTEVPLASHDVVTMEYGSHNPLPDKLYVFPSTLPT